MQDRRVPLGTYRGLPFGMVLHPQGRPNVYLEGVVLRLETLSLQHKGPRAVLKGVERSGWAIIRTCCRIASSG